MDTRKKLSEARFFLDKLSYAYDDETDITYYLSAFLSAWRSVLDIMLYDFCEYFSLGFTREEKINDQMCIAVASVLNKTQAIEFIKWWRQKQGFLKNTPLWNKRTLIVHRGYPPVESIIYYVMSSGANSSTISGFGYDYPYGYGYPFGETIPTTTPTDQFDEVFSFSDYPDISIIHLCADAYDEMEAIVKEAETKFEVKL